MTTDETIYIPLLNEGVDVWRPAPAQRLSDGTYRVLSTPTYDPADETWEFPPGSRVTCERRQMNGGNVLVAIRKAPNERQAV